MKLQLIDGQYTQTEAMDMITQLVQVKIQFLEKKIEKSHQEEDIKMRETRVKNLQKELNDIREKILSANVSVHLDAEISLREFVKI